VKEHKDGCFCEFCMTLDRVRMLRAQLAGMEAQLRSLAAAQRVTTDDLNKTIDAQRYDLSGPLPIRRAPPQSEEPG
jgi:hypothetical protein